MRSPPLGCHRAALLCSIQYGHTFPSFFFSKKFQLSPWYALILRLLASHVGYPHLFAPPTPWYGLHNTQQRPPVECPLPPPICSGKIPGGSHPSWPYLDFVRKRVRALVTAIRRSHQFAPKFPIFVLVFHLNCGRVFEHPSRRFFFCCRCLSVSHPFFQEFPSCREEVPAVTLFFFCENL